MTGFVIFTISSSWMRRWEWCLFQHCIFIMVHWQAGVGIDKLRTSLLPSIKFKVYAFTVCAFTVYAFTVCAFTVYAFKVMLSVYIFSNVFTVYTFTVMMSVSLWFHSNTWLQTQSSVCFKRKSSVCFQHISSFSLLQTQKFSLLQTEKFSLFQKQKFNYTSFIP